MYLSFSSQKYYTQLLIKYKPSERISKINIGYTQYNLLLCMCKNALIVIMLADFTTLVNTCHLFFT